MSVAEYATGFDELAQLAPTMVPTDEAGKMKFMHSLHLENAKQIDSGKEGPESYTDIIQRVLRNEGWDKQEDKSVETRSACPSDGKERKENYRNGGQSSSRSRKFNRNSRPSLKRQSSNFSESRPRYDNRNREGSKRRPKNPDNQNTRSDTRPEKKLRRLRRRWCHNALSAIKLTQESAALETTASAIITARKATSREITRAHPP